MILVCVAPLVPIGTRRKSGEKFIQISYQFDFKKWVEFYASLTSKDINNQIYKCNYNNCKW